MNPQQKPKIAPIKIPSEIQDEADEFMSIVTLTEELLEKLERSGKILRKSTQKSSEARKEGNALYTSKIHDLDIHHEILKQYSKSIAFAPKGSEELAQGYGNRSVLLMHLRKHKEALIDIERALQLTNSDDYKKKLQARKEKCQGLINQENLTKSAKNLTLRNKQESLASKLMKFKPSPTVPCAADCVGVGYNEKFGRHLVATRNIKSGEMLIVEEGQVAYPALNELYLVCSHCLQYAWNGIPCDECVYTMYCSQTCKDEASKEYHDIECPIVKYMHHVIFDTERNGCDRMLDIRLLVTAIRKEGFESILEEISKKDNKENLEVLLTDGILKSDKFKSFYNLSPHTEDLERENSFYGFHSSQILYLLLKYTDFISLIQKNPSADDTPSQTVAHDFKIDPYILLNLKEAITKLKYVTSINEYPFDASLWKCKVDESKPGPKSNINRTKGIVITPSCSLLNHSCLPNVTHLCVPKRKIIAFATSPIKKGEMLCDSYQEITIYEGDTRNRISRLRAFHFTCKCEACLNDIDMSKVREMPAKDSKKIATEMAKNFPKSVKNSKFQNAIKTWEVSEEVLEYMSKMSQLYYKYFNYYEAFKHNFTPCLAYIEFMMSELYEENAAIPHDCQNV